MPVVIVVRIVKPQHATVVTLVCGMVDINQVIKGMTGVHTKLDVQHNWLKKYYAATSLQGFSSNTPALTKFCVLRVTTVNPCSIAVAAIMASRSERGSGT
jgi:hypothetical protein